MAQFKISDLLKHNDVILAIGIASIIGMLLLPLPAIVLDMLLTIDIALAVTILMVTLYTREPLQYSTFPIILLVATLFRLGLSVSATRLILTTGEAGEVIHAFGNFVIGGNYLVGVMLFLILVIINFMVITNGAGRVSEVAARFTLDAMPGKQIAIDAELNAGMIDEREAKRRRQLIQKEADFYGTMDGASKFVKGDATAGLIIMVVNIVGGLIVGVFQLGQPIMEAISHFTILTIGDGLVTQLPALIISAATGILVTRTSKSDDEDAQLGDDIQHQMFENPKVLGIVGGLIGGLSLVPGLPKLPFMIIGGLAIWASYALNKKHQHKREADEQQAQLERTQEKTKRANSSDGVLDLLQVEPMELEIGYRLVTLLEAEHKGDLLDRIAQIRRQTAVELGILLPSVRVRDNLQLPPNHYNIKLRGVVIDSGEVRPDMWLAMNTDGTGEKIKGIATKEPAFGLPAFWIYTDQKEEAESKNYTVVSPSAVVATHLSEVVKRYAPDIFSRIDAQYLLDNLKKTAEPLVDDLIPDLLTVAEVHVILQNLLRERVSIKDLSGILEALSYHARVNKDKDYLTEQARMALSRSICKQYYDESGHLPVVTLAPDVEETLAAGLSDNGELMALSPVFTQNLLSSINKEIERVLSSTGVQPVLLCNSKVRLPLRRLIERMLPQIGVLSYNEIGPTVKATALGSISVDAQAVSA